MIKTLKMLCLGFILAYMSTICISEVCAMESSINTAQINNWAAKSDLKAYLEFLNLHREGIAAREGYKGDAREVWKLVKANNLEKAKKEEQRALNLWQRYIDDIRSLGVNPSEHRKDEGDGITKYKNPDEYKDKFKESGAIRSTHWYHEIAEKMYGGQVQATMSLETHFVQDAQLAYSSYEKARLEHALIESMQQPEFLAAQPKKK
ncbi:MAG: hypothetical protein K2Q34_01085 [Alphaproteobacteria bacterium]|nr:hypothetical protein [Alphaproteobacteria bacterium]